MNDAERLAELRHRLGRVTDPELDEPVTELGFVTDLSADAAGVVSIAFRLPTYWCAANFAFMMADDMRREALSLPWVTRVSLTLCEHMYGDTINRGIAEGLSFKEAFADAASGDLDDLRRIFLVKSFQRRQEPLLRHLLDAGHAPEQLTRLTLAALRSLNLGADGDGLRSRYLERRGVPRAESTAALAFVDPDGVPLVADRLSAHLDALRRVGIGIEFNGTLCRGLLAARFGDGPAALPANPDLIDFVRMPAAERPAAH